MDIVASIQKISFEKEKNQCPKEQEALGLVGGEREQDNRGCSCAMFACNLQHRQGYSQRQREGSTERNRNIKIPTLNRGKRSDGKKAWCIEQRRTQGTNILYWTYLAYQMASSDAARLFYLVHPYHNYLRALGKGKPKCPEPNRRLTFFFRILLELCLQSNRNKLIL